MNLPNRLTVFRLVLCGVLVVLLEKEGIYSGLGALLVFIAASLTDWLDGWLARRLDMVTNLGKLLDPLADKILVCATYIGLVGHDLLPVWFVVCVVAREFLITGLRTLAAAGGVVMAAERLGKHKTITQIATAIAGLLILALLEAGLDTPRIDLLRFWVLQPLWILALLVTIVSGLAYFMKNRHFLLEDPPRS
jgi:CDP-diacylglycerol--glycerol-3-phosphate 3-phosphatidyltransferase